MSATPPNLSSQERQILLSVARREAARALDVLPLAVRDADTEVTPIPGRFGGVFVTLWNGRALRGCMGSFASTTNLVESVKSVTRSSLSDPRFVGDPVDASELARITMEISVLSDLTPVYDVRTIRPGVHGVVVRRGDQTGCFLPKVAVEQGWSVATLLSMCCEKKAGLPSDSWRDPETRLFTFTAEVFAERGRDDADGPSGSSGTCRL